MDDERERQSNLYTRTNWITSQRGIYKVTHLLTSRQCTKRGVARNLSSQSERSETRPGLHFSHFIAFLLEVIEEVTECGLLDVLRKLLDGMLREVADLQHRMSDNGPLRGRKLAED